VFDGDERVAPYEGDEDEQDGPEGGAAGGTAVAMSAQVVRMG